MLLRDIHYNHLSFKNLVIKNDIILTKTSIDSKHDLKTNSIDLKFINIEKYCPYDKILKVTAYVLRSFNNLKGCSRKKNTNLLTLITKHERDLGEH